MAEEGENEFARHAVEGHGSAHRDCGVPRVLLAGINLGLSLLSLVHPPASHFLPVSCGVTPAMSFVHLAGPARAPQKMRGTQSRDSPAPSYSTHVYTCCLSLLESWPLGTTRNEAEGWPGREAQASDCHHLALLCIPTPGEGAPSVHYASGLVVPWAMPSDLLLGGQWPLPVPSSPGTWFCSWVDVAC